MSWQKLINSKILDGFVITLEINGKKRTGYLAMVKSKEKEEDQLVMTFSIGVNMYKSQVPTLIAALQALYINIDQSLLKEQIKNVFIEGIQYPILEISLSNDVMFKEVLKIMKENKIARIKKAEKDLRELDHIIEDLDDKFKKFKK